MTDLPAIVEELASRPRHSKVQTLVYTLLTRHLGVPSRDIDFEQHLREVRGRVDALLGRTVFEFKSDLRNELADAQQQLTRYLEERESATVSRYVGIATDGAEFIAYERTRDGELAELGRHATSAESPHGLHDWLVSVLALGEALAPEPDAIKRELGRGSPTYRRAQAELTVLWARVGDRPDVQVKRKLWGDYLEQVYGTRVGADLLFLQHTYLAVVAKTMATSVLGRPVDDAAELLAGEPFTEAGIHGAVESDFFDWILAADGGADLVLRLARQAGRFRLADVEHDVLKGLYESLIDPEQRHDLGEYYTPDWLAAWMSERAIKHPLEQRVLDPACGSGTFLFWAVRRFLDAAGNEGWEAEHALSSCTDHVLGIDVHPVAVTIARVTYLLALGEERLRKRRGALSVPVYLGDSLQWNTSAFFGRQEVRIQVSGGTELHFPANIAADPTRFDDTVQAMVDYSEPPASEVPAFRGWMRKHCTTDSRDIETLERTYETMVALREAGRNHIWGYVLRNLSRPFWLSAPDRKVDVVIGNPPWLSYRYMARSMQARFRDECRERGLWAGGKVATHQDISAYFFARSVELYLNEGGIIGFVMPYAALSRRQFRGFRSQRFAHGGRRQLVCFEDVWSFADVEPLFPVPSCAIFARHAHEGERTDTMAIFAGALDRRDAGSAEAKAALSKHTSPWPEEGQDVSASAYGRAFRQGATIVPRRLWVVERVSAGRFGTNPEAPLIRSRASRQEKSPWKDLEPLEQTVEAKFIWCVYFGESVAPFRLLNPLETVVPWECNKNPQLLTANQARSRGYSGLARWLTEAEGLWQAKRTNETMSLLARLDYHHELTKQLPPTSLRILYAKSGSVPCAAILRDKEALVDHTLYWMPVEDEQEALYLQAVLNSEVLQQRVAKQQSRGQWGHGILTSSWPNACQDMRRPIRSTAN